MLWILAGFWLLGLTMSIVSWLKLGRFPVGVAQDRDRCPTCNYSLDGLADGAACPECGLEDVVLVARVTPPRRLNDMMLVSASLVIGPLFAGVSMLLSYVSGLWSGALPWFLAALFLGQYAITHGAFHDRVAHLDARSALLLLVAANASVCLGSWCALFVLISIANAPLILVGLAVPIMGPAFAGYGLLPTMALMARSRQRADARP